MTGLVPVGTLEIEEPFFTDRGRDGKLVYKNDCRARVFVEVETRSYAKDRTGAEVQVTGNRSTHLDWALTTPVFRERGNLMAAETAEKVVVEVQRDKVLALMAFAGWKTAGKWDNAKISSRLPSIKDVIPDDKKPDDEDVSDTLITVMAAIEEHGENVEFKVTGDEPEAAKKPTKREKKEKKAKPPKEKKLSRAHHAGAILKELGVRTKIDDKLIAEVDTRYGTPNKKYSQYALVNVQNGLLGYLGDDAPPAEVKSDDKESDDKS